MPPRYIFAIDIQEALLSEDKVLKIPRDSRLSPQAADLVREYNLRVVYEDQEDQARETPSPAPPAPREQAVMGFVAKENDRLDEAQVEEIVERILARLAQAKGEEPPAPATAAPSPTPDTPPAPDDDLVICRCEEITKGQIKQAIRDGLATLNGVKRVTRAGMGLCQGQTCARLVSAILAQELGLSPAQVEPTTARAPSRPVPMAVFATG